MVKFLVPSAFIGILLSAPTLQADNIITVPAAIRPDKSHLPYLIAHANGRQIYQCSLQNGAYEWVLQGPKAQLTDDKGHLIGWHDYGPVWRDGRGGRITGKILNTLEIHPPSATPWLLLKIIDHQGKGDFTKAAFINRIHTIGGLPPSSACNANHLGSEKQISYRADYVFYD
jgi:hypothetical protein